MTQMIEKKQAQKNIMYTDIIDTVILAAGKSTRFKQPLTKLLTPLCGQALIEYQLKTLNTLQLSAHIVIGHQADEIKQKLFNGCSSRNIHFILQKEQCGTGHALLCTLPHLQKEYVLVINGDMPDLSSSLLHEFIIQHVTSSSDVSIGVATTAAPFSYGRVIENGKAINIIEEKNCTEEEKQITNINAGIYLFKRALLETLFKESKIDQKSGELFLPDLVNTASKKELKVSTFIMPFEQIQGINTLEEATLFETRKQKEIIFHWMNNGVTFIKPETIVVDINCTLAPHCIIYPGAIIKNNSHIGEQAIIGPYSIIEQSIIGAWTEVLSHSVIRSSRIGSLAKVGPFAHIHTETQLEEQTLIGNFVEVKKSHIQKKSKAKHLSYIGDALIGKAVNIGAGTITANFDGVQKHKTIIHDEVSIGANNSLVAPVTIEQGAITAAGSTITELVPAYALAIARERQTNKLDYATKKKKLHENSIKASRLCPTSTRNSQAT
jgi:bifunctional UDP-N-acetylglucosamine pyrophosphorylase/glucosamine-1-phosphate N-acetyltransferase